MRRAWNGSVPSSISSMAATVPVLPSPSRQWSRILLPFFRNATRLGQTDVQCASNSTTEFGFVQETDETFGPPCLDNYRLRVHHDRCWWYARSLPACPDHPGAPACARRRPLLKNCTSHKKVVQYHLYLSPLSHHFYAYHLLLYLIFSLYFI